MTCRSPLSSRRGRFMVYLLIWFMLGWLMWWVVVYTRVQTLCLPKAESIPNQRASSISIESFALTDRKSIPFRRLVCQEKWKVLLGHGNSVYMWPRAFAISRMISWGEEGNDSGQKGIIRDPVKKTIIPPSKTCKKWLKGGRRKEPTVCFQLGLTDNHIWDQKVRVREERPSYKVENRAWKLISLSILRRSLFSQPPAKSA